MAENTLELNLKIKAKPQSHEPIRSFHSEKTFKVALQDILGGLKNPSLWLLLGWRDIQQCARGLDMRANFIEIAQPLISGERGAVIRPEGVEAPKPANTDQDQDEDQRRDVDGQLPPQRHLPKCIILGIRRERFSRRRSAATAGLLKNEYHW